MPVPRYPDIIHRPRKQQGAALMIMLVILIFGAAAILVSSLSSSGLRIERDKITADALAQAKDALIGRAVADNESPGSLACPDTGNNGTAESPVGQPNGDCPSYIGRLPWKTLGLPDLRDGKGERLWYALSPNFRDYVNLNHINSESLGMLNISGDNAASNVIAIVFSPGNAINGQKRSSSQTVTCATTSTTIAEDLCATNYLEGNNASLNLQATPNTSYQNAVVSTTFNDQLIYITYDHLFPAVEMRIAREAKSCLDNYAALSNGKYPWAALVSDTSNYLSQFGVRFGRLPVQPGISLDSPSDPVLAALVDTLASLQLALNSYAAAVNSSTKNALINAGTALVNASNTAKNNQPTTPTLSNSITNQINQTGDQVSKLANNQGGLTVADIQADINTANSNLSAAGVTTVSNDPAMSLAWPSGCIVTSSYWTAWRNLIFYQVANGYQPGSSASCISCLSISGSGNHNGGSGTYHAAVAVARKMQTGQTIRNPAVTSDYLESPNPHDNQTLTAFETYAPDDAQYQTDNDLVLCLDGKINCM